MLDVGCSVGLMFKPFIKKGWICEEMIQTIIM